MITQPNPRNPTLAHVRNARLARVRAADSGVVHRARGTGCECRCRKVAGITKRALPDSKIGKGSWQRTALAGRVSWRLKHLQPQLPTWLRRAWSDLGYRPGRSVIGRRHDPFQCRGQTLPRKV